MATPTGDRKDVILQIATELLSTQGCAATTLGQIASLVGITEPGVYYWVGSKEQLIVEVVAPLLDAIDELLAEPGDGSTLDFLLAYATTVDAHRDLARLVDQDLIELRRLAVLGERLDAQALAVRHRVERGMPEGRPSMAAAMVGAIRRPLTVLDDPLPPDRRVALVEAIHGALAG